MAHVQPNTFHIELKKPTAKVEIVHGSGPGMQHLRIEAPGLIAKWEPEGGFYQQDHNALECYNLHQLADACVKVWARGRPVF